eukprot:4038634-Pleurochrysis_carterae.AAC.1
MTGGLAWRLASGRDIDVKERLNVSEGIGIRVAGAEDGAQVGVAVENPRKMLPHEELLCRSRFFRAHPGQEETLVSEAKDVVRRGI